MMTLYHGSLSMKKKTIVGVFLIFSMLNAKIFEISTTKASVLKLLRSIFSSPNTTHSTTFSCNK